jgi:2-oxoglutarate ferredoxin oxidoreductase subunit gamma
MTHDILFAGFGGQGVLSMGMTLAYAGMVEGKEVSWMPSYGPEMRGGTANCIVILSDHQISSPILSRFDSVVALNQPSLDKFEKSVKPGGLLIYDSTNIIRRPTRTDITVAAVPASEAAVEMRNTKVMNMIVLGAFLELRFLVPLESVLEALRHVLPERHHHLIPLNQQALERGRELAKRSTESFVQ